MNFGVRIGGRLVVAPHELLRGARAIMVKFLRLWSNSCDYGQIPAIMVKFLRLWSNSGVDF